MYIGPFKLLTQIENVAYQLTLQPELSVAQAVLHVSTLKTYVCDLRHVVKHQPLKIQRDLTYEEI